MNKLFMDPLANPELTSRTQVQAEDGSGVFLAQTHPNRLRPWQRFLQWLGFAIAYAGLVILSEAAEFPGRNPTPLYLSGGVLLLALLTSSPRRWPIVLLASLLVAQIVILPVVSGLDEVYLRAWFGQALGVTLSAAMIRRWTSWDKGLIQPWEIASLMTALLVVSPGLSALVKCWAITSPAPGVWWPEFLLNWACDAMGMVMAGPVMLCCWEIRFRLDRQRSLKQQIEVVLLLLFTGVLAWSIFSTQPDVEFARFGQYRIPPFLLIPALIWIAARSSAFGVVAASFLVLSMALLRTIEGVGPFAISSEGSWQSGMLLSLYLATLMAITAMTRSQLYERIRVEQMRAFEESRWEMALGANSHGILDCDLRTGQALYSARWLQIMGMEGNPTPTRLENWLDRIHPEDRITLEQRLKDYLIRKSDVFEVVHRVHHRDGDYRQVRARGITNVGESDIPTRFVCSLQDITEHEKAEEALRESERLFRIVADSAPVMIWMGESVKEFSFLNWTAVKFLGRDPRYLLGEGWLEAVHPDDLQSRLHTAEAAMRAQKGFTAEYRLRRGDGEFRWVCENAVPRLGIESKRMTYIGTISDINERKESEQRSRRAMEAAESAARAKSDFLANMSHEIRTPLNGILGISELALLDPESSERNMESFRLVRSSAEALLTVINDILDFSKLDAGMVRIDRARFHLVNLVEDLARVHAIRVRAKNLEVICRIDPRVPDYALGDPDRIRQVLNNLLGNAVKFTHSGMVSIQVDLVTGERGTSLYRFRIADTGIGISSKKQKSIFLPFEQADQSTTREFGGTGLGLSISQKLVRLMGGDIQVRSTEGKGSTFAFAIRLEPVNLSLSFMEQNPVRGRRFLVIAEMEEQRRVISEYLGACGAQVHGIAGTAAAAMAFRSVDSCAASLYDVILIDGGGSEQNQAVVDLIRAFPGMKDVPWIAMVCQSEAHSSRDDRFQTYLTKPLRRHELIEAVGRTLQKRPVQRPKSSPSQGVVPLESRKWKILLAEDHPINRLVATKMLENLGHEVHTAEDGSEAVRLAETHVFDLILMDIQMPCMDGFEALRAIRSRLSDRNPKLPIVALTAHALDQNRERCLAAGFNDYLSKPVRPEDLRRLLKNLETDSILQEDRDSPPIPPTDDFTLAIHEFCGNDLDFQLDLIGTFLQSTPAGIDRIEGSFASKRFKEAALEAHGLRGACRSLGLNELGNILQSLESSAGDNSEYPEPGLIILRECWKSTRSMLLSYQKTIRPSAGIPAVERNQGGIARGISGDECSANPISAS